MLFTLENAAFSYGDNLIFSGVNFTVNEGERVGLIGGNGAGKTTLIRLVLGELVPDSGSVLRKNGARIGFLEQNGGYESGNTVYAEMRKVFAEELAAVEKVARLSEELAAAEYGGREYAALSARLESLNKFIASRECYDIDVKIRTVLNGMSFGGMYERVIDSMSGGEKTRLKLARLLLERPDLLILDEPTNHLDISTLFWLEEYLASYRGAVLVVSHDRYFLDSVCKKTAELENHGLVVYTGNYTKYKSLKAERQARLWKEYEAQCEERKKLQTYVDKNIVRATTAKSAQSRVKQLERMELLARPYTPPAPPSFAFSYDVKPYENVLTCDNFDLEIGGKQLIVGGQLNVSRGEKVAIVGENGTGKTTLLKAMIRGDHPKIAFGRYARPALYDQEAANLDGENTVLYELWGRHTGLTQTEVRALLARGGLYAEDMEKPVKALSGGERAKLALCILETERANVLLLDEPTNHLDLPARESLEKALQAFDGTLIFVSHDRYFLAALADRVAEIDGARLTITEGGYEGYLAGKRARREEEKRAELCNRQAQAAERQSASYRSRSERAAQARKKEQIKKIEADICAVEREESEINAKLADPEILSDYKKVAELSARLEGVKNRLDDLYKQYEEMI